ncbi:MAG TPA: hypothetical protein GX517_11720 [Alicyclobacillus sp.]|nr:hypothetical protein [Alicyclobacillus sp.]
MSRTYDQILNELKLFVKQRWPNWNIDAKHIGNILLECLADQIEKMEYRMDELEHELFPDTAVRYESILRWARMLGYEVQSAKPAEVTLTFSVPEPASADIPIPKGTKVSTPGADPITFATAVDAVIQAGQTSVEVAAKQVEVKKDVFTGTGEPSQVYQTTYGPVWMESMRVVVDGREWTMVREFLLSKSTDLHYSSELQEDGTALLIFGDGVNGKALPYGSTCELEYMITKGDAGNVPAGTITVLETVLYDVNGYIADVRVTNTEPATEGTDQEDINHIREALPGWVSSFKACITKSDFEKVAGSTPGVARVYVATNETDKNVPPLTVVVYIVPEGGGEASQVLIDRVMEELTVKRPKVVSLVVKVQQAKYVPVDVVCSIVVGYGYDKEQVSTEVETAIRDFFGYERKEGDGTYAIDFGRPVYVSRLINHVMMTVPGTANITVQSPSDMYPKQDEIPILRSVTINVA